MLFLLPHVIALVATFVFMFLVWRRTRILGYAVLAAEFLIMFFYSRFITYLPNIFTEVPSIFRSALLLSFVNMVAAVVAALAWWNIYARTTQLGPDNPSKPTPVRGAA
jgi:hypothetical protein